MFFRREAQQAQQAEPAASPAAPQAPALPATAPITEPAPRAVLPVETAAAAAKIRAAALGEIVGLLLATSGHKSLTLGEIERRFLPAIGLGQFSIAYARTAGSPEQRPVAAVLWADVSDALDQVFAAAPDQPMVLAADDWTSGRNTWIVEAIGEQGAVQNVLRHLVQSQFRDRPPRIRVRDRDGKPSIARLQVAPAT